MKLLKVTLETSQESEDALTVYSQDQLGALGVEAIRRRDFEEASHRQDSTVVDWQQLTDIPADVRLVIYFDQEADYDQLAVALKQKLVELAGYGLATGSGTLVSQYVQDEDWNTVWQQYYHPIAFSRHLAIVPEWEDYQPAFADQQLLQMDPGLAFGTGNHETTQLSMMGLEQSLVRPCRVVDVGTGSGILAIAAAKLGAAEVLGTDISSEAMDAATTNLQLNGLTNVKLQHTSLLADVSGQFDIIVANILAEILLQLISQLQSHLAPGGRVIFSGIDYLQLPKVMASLTDNGFQVDLTLRAKRWVGLIITRKAK